MLCVYGGGVFFFARFFPPEKIGCFRSCFRAIFSGEKIEMFFFIFIISSDSNHRHTMAQQQQQPQNPHKIDRMDPAQNGMEEYERITTEWNQSNQVQENRRHRSQLINNTAGYHTGNRIHHLLSIQMYDPADWNALFGRENLDPALREYAQASMDWVQDETCTLLFAGQMDVVMMMQENYRPGVHVAVFIVHLSPHRRFQDGHVIQKEFSEGSVTHQTINRLFDPNSTAIVLQATQYQLLDYLADDDEAMDLLHSCFLDHDFNTRRFSYVEPVERDDDEDEDGEEHGVDDEDNGYYVANPYANDDHNWHECAEYYQQRQRQQQQQQGQDPEEEPAVIAIPPPPPVNDFAAIYQRNLEMYHDDDDNYDDNIIRNENQPREPRRNIIHYIYHGDGDSDNSDSEDEEIHAQG